MRVIFPFSLGGYWLVVGFYSSLFPSFIYFLFFILSSPSPLTSGLFLLFWPFNLCYKFIFFVYVYQCVCAFMCTHVCIHTYKHACIHVPTRVFWCVYVCMSLFLCVCLCKCVCILLVLWLLFFFWQFNKMCGGVYVIANVYACLCMSAYTHAYNNVYIHTFTRVCFCVRIARLYVCVYLFVCMLAPLDA